MKTVTAIFRTHATADRVRNDIITTGVGTGDVDIVPNDPNPLATGTTRDDVDAMDRLHHYGLPDDDVRTYQHAVRNGDYVVAARVDDEHLATVQEIMRNPDHAVNEDELRTRYADEQLIAPSGRPLAAMGSTSTIGAADDGRQTYADPMESGEHRRGDHKLGE